jgi:hypothetical protein
MSYWHFFEILKPDETAQNFEKRVLQKCLRITFYTYKPVIPFHFLKKHQNRCTLLSTCLVYSIIMRVLINIPHPPLPLASVYPRLCWGEDTLARRRGGWEVNILEDERNRIALLQ